MIRIHEEVADALADRRAVVALESTIFSEFGLPATREPGVPGGLRRRGARRGAPCPR